MLFRHIILTSIIIIFYIKLKAERKYFNLHCWLFTKKIYRKVKCDECKDYLKNKTEQISCSIIELKNNNKVRYGLIKPEHVICTIIRECEQILCSF